jgi:ADP-heptose:LPS heptosyltransferase
LNFKISNSSIKNSIKPENILLIRTDRIGDVILTLPLVDTLKYNYPDAKIDIMVNKRVFELVQDYPNINKVHAIEKDSIKDILRISKSDNYDTAIIVRPLFSIALAVFLSGIKYRLGTGYRWYSFLFNIKHFQHRKYSIKHELEYNLDLLNELKCERIEDIVPKFLVNDNLLVKVKQKLIDKGVNLSKDIVIFHPGTLGSAKSWSVENFVKLIHLLYDDKSCDFSLLVTGTISDNYVLNKIEDIVGIKVVIIKDLDLIEYPALCKLAKIFVSNSTGPIHIAAAVGTFCVGFYSPIKVESAVRWAPYTEKKKIFTPEVNGRNIPDNVMDSIIPERVFEFIKNYILSTKN